MDESEEVFYAVFPPGDGTAEVVHPGEEALNLPAFLVAAQLASVLLNAIGPKRVIWETVLSGNSGCWRNQAIARFDCWSSCSVASFQTPWVPGGTRNS